MRGVGKEPIDEGGRERWEDERGRVSWRREREDEGDEGDEDNGDSVVGRYRGDEDMQV